MSEMENTGISHAERLGENNNESRSLENLTPQEDDVIPTAIVIKNIPFAIKKEQLLDVVAKMDLPLPYAFNYHFDNGVFRGLAFANFTNTEETTQVLTSLNGKEIGGRKLRVEYKKMLPQAERERIEREKREKRGQLEEQHKSLSNLSLHSLSKTPLMGGAGGGTAANNHIFPGFINENGTGGATPLSNNQVLLSAQSTATSFYQQSNPLVAHPQDGRQRQGQPVAQQQQTQQQQQRHPFLQQQTNGGPVTGGVNSNIGTNMSGPIGAGIGVPGSVGGNQLTGGLERYYAPLPSSSTLPLPPQQLDFNDPDTLEIYSQLLLFKDRERFYYELAYPVGLSASHKRIINVLCSFLGLVEIYDPTFIIIRKKVLDKATLQSHLQQQGQVTMSHPLQPSSTGGSMNRSQSYTSLLQAHAAASVAAAANGAPQPPSGGSATTTPKMQTHAQMSSQQQQQQQQQQVLPTQASAASTQGGIPSSPSQLLQPIALHHSEPQQQTPQQQQQSFLRQQAALTPSSRIPSGYSSIHAQVNNVNPLLRNVNGISPPSATVPPNTAQHRVPQPFYGNPAASNAPTAEASQPMVAQHTNGSLHSNFSSQSFCENLAAAADMNGALGAEMVYTSLGTSGLGNGLEEGLSRSLSGLDLQANTPNLGNYGTNTARKPIW
ncbi:PIN4 (YBL051C) [Zygosaccharomyces parabailii]|nr:PIN4 (YBL051C) [Zygosaccharomyces parabailii]